LTWKSWDMPSGPPICALRASARRTSGNACGGWQTPMADDARGVGGANSREGHHKMLHHQARGWPTPQGFDAKSTADWTPGSTWDRQTPDHTLPQAAALAGWPTPKVATGDYQYGKGHDQRFLNLSGAAKLAGWPSPSTATGGQVSPPGTTAEGRTPDGRKQTVNLQHVARMAGWPSPNAEEFGLADVERLKQRRAECKARTGNGNGFGLTLGQCVKVNALGTTPSGSPAPTGRRGALNPAFCLWLMGFPAAWGRYAPQEMRSSRKSRPRS
jgi:hypothetical protein